LLHRLERCASDRVRRDAWQRTNRGNLFRHAQAKPKAKVMVPMGAYGAKSMFPNMASAFGGNRQQQHIQRGPVMQSEHQRQMEVQKEMVWILLWEDNTTLADELERKQVPFVKFTGHTAFLSEYKKVDFLKWKSTMRRLFLRALGQQWSMEKQDACNSRVAEEDAQRKAKEEAERRADEATCRVVNECRTQEEAECNGKEAQHVANEQAERKAREESNDKVKERVSHEAAGPQVLESLAVRGEDVHREAVGPKLQADDERIVWRVVGGQDTGGILVRAGSSLTSAPASSTAAGSRISTGALVEQLELQGMRLHYRRLTGAGPDSGWVSVRIHHKQLLVREFGPP